MKKSIIILLTLFLCICSLSAQEVNSTDSTGIAKRKKVGLVLSGGGAKGVAHIGVLKVLEEAKIPIDFIAGTSMGAIIGGLYSIGYSTHELDSMVRSQNWAILLSDQVDRSKKVFYERERGDTYMLSVNMDIDKKFSLPSGVVAGQNVLNLLNEMTIGFHNDELDFNTLPIPFACVAYDITKGEQVVFNCGNLAYAIRSSMSIPGAFAPVRRGNMLLVDGGVYNNYPVDIAKEMGADIIIGVDLLSNQEEKLNSIVGVINQLAFFIGRDKYNENLTIADLNIKPEVEPYSSGSFFSEAIDSLILRGERAAHAKMPEILKLKEDHQLIEECVPHCKERMVLDSDSVRIGSIRFVGLTNNEDNIIRLSLRIKENSTTTKAHLHNAIQRLRGSGAFSYLTYSLDYTPPYDLHIYVNEAKEAALSIGFRFDTEDMAGILLSTKLSFRGLYGPDVGLSVRLNNNPYIKVNYNSGNWVLGRVGVSYIFKNNNFNIYKNGIRKANVAFALNRFEFNMISASLAKFQINAGVQYEHFNYHSFLFASSIDNNLTNNKSEGFINYCVDGYYETLDDTYFPTSGVSLYTRAMIHTSNGYEYVHGSAPFGDISVRLIGAISPLKRVSLVGSVKGRVIIGSNVAFPYTNFMGGDLIGRYMIQQIPFIGIRRVERFDNSILTASAEIRYRVFKQHYLSMKGSVGVQHDDFFQLPFVDKYMWGLGLKYSHNTPIGPLTIQFATSSISKGFDAYLSFGKNF